MIHSELIFLLGAIYFFMAGYMFASMPTTIYLSTIIFLLFLSTLEVVKILQTKK